MVISSDEFKYDQEGQRPKWLFANILTPYHALFIIKQCTEKLKSFPILKTHWTIIMLIVNFSMALASGKPQSCCVRNNYNNDN